ncbi:MAG: hypothetical protein ABIG03_06295 [Candidatus Eisenbacteria bacterium]
MNRRAIVFTAIAVTATVASVVIGARAIVGTAATLRHSTQANAQDPGALERTGGEVEQLLISLEDARTSGETAEPGRDPMVPYVAPRPASAPRSTAPAKPTYKVTAVFIDDNPMAILSVNGKSVRVNVGDLVAGGRVVAIENDGVTIDEDGGEKKYTYSP